MSPSRTVGYFVLTALVGMALWRALGRGSPVEVEATRPCMGTLVRVKVFAPDTSRGWTAIEEAFAEISRIEAAMAATGAGELARINGEAGSGWVSLSDGLAAVIQRSLHFSRATGGAFDITIGPVEALWGFSSDKLGVPSAEAIASKLSWVGYQNLEIEGKRLRLKSGMKLNLGGAAKGYAVDRAVQILSSNEIESALVEAGGDIRFIGTKPGGRAWRIAVQHPRHKDRLILINELGLPAVATSGDYERFFEREGIRYHHILDPETGRPASTTVSTTVWASTTLDADILSTAVFVMGPERGMDWIERTEGTEALIFFQEEGTLRHRMSNGLKGKLSFEK